MSQMPDNQTPAGVEQKMHDDHLASPYPWAEEAALAVVSLGAYAGLYAFERWLSTKIDVDEMEFATVILLYGATIDAVDEALRRREAKP